MHFDEDGRIRSDTSWYKLVLNALNMQVTIVVSYTHSSNPLLHMLMKREDTKDWVRLLPWAVLTMSSQRSSSTCLAWIRKISFPEELNSPVEDWLEHKQKLGNQAALNLKHICERELTKRNRQWCPTSYRVGDLLLVHYSRLPSWLRNSLQGPYFGHYRIINIDRSRIHVRCRPRLGGELLCPPKQPRHYHFSEDVACDDWRLSDKEVVRIENTASPEEAGKLEEMAADEMAVDGYYVVAGICTRRV